MLKRTEGEMLADAGISMLHMKQRIKLQPNTFKIKSKIVSQRTAVSSEKYVSEPLLLDQRGT